jgi:hypothetical protein
MNPSYSVLVWIKKVGYSSYAQRPIGAAAGLYEVRYTEKWS